MYQKKMSHCVVIFFLAKSLVMVYIYEYTKLLDTVYYIKTSLTFIDIRITIQLFSKFQAFTQAG